ncbi:2-dehydro-3-deoxygluconokinase [Arthrobacter sp. JUb119]|uniref:sugar kinase n=1 Tax=Arthrobacter sp. JUb115 TaxID=2485108 RepID=UPI001061D632|nr:sugar kinase [Arthrobacter sp. JUb115]MCS3494525.1 2-dehydro-3-deoxygluconokinase [Arthrobacter sp. JUb119]TDU22615.1 2-dehydro-3-deoxygluconokinase [Arthrobacter sp. JUb115]
MSETHWEKAGQPEAVLTFGETMGLFRTSPAGPLANANAASVGVGGSESNVAIGIQRLGGQAIWCGRVGEDPIGYRVLREIRGEAVLAHAVIDTTAPTGLMVKEQRTNQHQRVMYYRAGSAGSKLEPSDIPDPILERAGTVHLTGITLALSDSARATCFSMARRAKARGLKVSFDVNYRAQLWSQSDATRVITEILALVDIVFAGEDEAQMIVGEGDPVTLAERMSLLGPAEVVIKRGSEGALALDNGVVSEVSAIQIQVIDTVGAGDAFVSGYLTERCAGGTVQQALATAVRVGAFACLSPGDWEGLPSRAELHVLDSSEPVLR